MESDEQMAYNLQQELWSNAVDSVEEIIEKSIENPRRDLVEQQNQEYAIAMEQDMKTSNKRPSPEKSPPKRDPPKRVNIRRRPPKQEEDSLPSEPSREELRQLRLQYFS